MVPMAGLGALEGGEVFRSEALLEGFDEGAGFGVAIVGAAGLVSAGDVHGVAVRVDGYGVVEGDGEEGDVDGWHG